MIVAPVRLFWFSGSGNTLVVARAVAETLRQAGHEARLLPLEKTSPAAVPTDGTLGLAWPVACGTTYPLVRRWLNGLPDAHGTPVLVLDTLGGASVGFGWLRVLLERKGYRPLAAREIVMPGNFLHIKPRSENDAVTTRGLEQAHAFARDLVAGTATWPTDKPLGRIGARVASGAMSLWPTRFSKAVLRQDVNADRCIRCGRCAAFCPVQAIRGSAGTLPGIGPACEYCQRCAAVCPVDAITTNGRAYAPHRAAHADALTHLLEEHLAC